MTVYEAILMGRHPISGWNVTDEDMRATDSIIRMMGLEQYADRRMDEVSAGQ